MKVYWSGALQCDVYGRLKTVTQEPFPNEAQDQYYLFGDEELKKITKKIFEAGREGVTSFEAYLESEEFKRLWEENDKEES